ncbi:MAG: carboxy terminal-processing peptidase [Kiritimatiellae bacterium]|nr:carboxy terminal-processing peptidase [Kiritimatiellia bacterium]
MKAWKSWGGPALLLASGIVWAAARSPSAPAEAAPSEAARLVARRLPQWHLSALPMDDQRAADALDRFLAFLDFDRSYFLAADVERFRTAVTNLDNRLAAGDVAFAYEVYDVLRERVSNRVAFAEGLLKEPFDLGQDETYVWKRKDAEWPADEPAWDDLWRRKIKNQYIAHLVNRELADATNAVAAAAPEDTPAEPAEEIDPPTDLRLAPEEAIRKSYRQYLDVLNDNRAEWPADRYLTAFAQAYDPHTDYMSASQTEDFEIGMQLSLVGIGARLTSEDGAAKIDQLIPGGPAEKDGRLKPNDKIIAVAQGDGEPVSILHWPLSKAVRLIRGEKNTKVVLSVIPASDPAGTTVVKIDLIREEVKLEDQAAKASIQEVAGSDGRTRKLGVITLPDFYADVRPVRGRGPEPRSSAQDVRRLLEELGTNGVEGLVLDLRNNGGGLLAEAVRMTGLFIERGPVVQVSDGRRSQVMSDSDPEVVYDGPMIVLVNRQTASASEILAGALQDYGRAVIAGDSKTHGKGTVQTLAELKDGQPALGKLKITTASFYRINGGSTQLRGVEPDIVTPSSLDTLEIGEETLPHALPWSQIRTLTYAFATPLREALPALQKKVEERRRNDARYQAYLELLNRLAERQKEPAVSLNFEKRLELARAEKELSRQLREKDAGKDEQADAMLNETLQILSDLISLTSEPAAPAAADGPVTASGPAS